jgi:hypothetical protein
MCPPSQNDNTSMDVFIWSGRILKKKALLLIYDIRLPLADSKVKILESEPVDQEKLRYMPMIIIELEEEEENKKPLLIDIMYAKRKNTCNDKGIVKAKKPRDIDFFMRHVMSFVIDMYKRKKK